MGEAGQRSRLFGTDGVRGVAGRDLTARLAMDLGVAAAAVLGRGAGARATRQRRPSPWSAVTRAPRASSSRRPWWPAWPVPGVDVAPARRHPDARRGLPDRGAGCRLRRGHLREPQPGPGQRDQVLRPAAAVKLPDAAEDEIEAQLGRQSAQPMPDGGEFGRVSDASAEHERYLDHLLATLPPAAAAGGPAGGGRLRARRGLPARPAGAAPGGRGGHHHRRRARRPEHQRGLRLHRARRAGRGGRRARRGRGHRL